MSTKTGKKKKTKRSKWCHVRERKKNKWRGIHLPNERNRESRATKGLGIKGTKVQKHQFSNLGSKSLQSQPFLSLGSFRAISNGSKHPRVDPTAMIQMGNMVQEQSCSELQRDDHSEKCSDHRNSEMVWGGTKQCVETLVLHNPN